MKSIQKPNDYLSTYVRPGTLSFAYAVARVKFLHAELEDRGVVEIEKHPSFERIYDYFIAKCGDVWVLLGKALCDLDECGNLSEYLKEANFEIALSLDKSKLLIWKDLHCV